MMNKEIEDQAHALGGLCSEFNDVEMRVMDVEMSARGAHTMIASVKTEVGELGMGVRDLNDLAANLNNQLERVQVEDISWCRSRISALEKPSNPTNRSLWQLVNALASRLDGQEDEMKDLKSGLARALEKIGNLEMSSSLVRGRVSTLEEVMEAAPTPTDLTSDEEYANVDDGGAMMVEDSEDERENMPPPPMVIRTATPHLAPVLRELIPIEDPARISAIEVDADGEDDAWYIPLVMRRRIHALDEFTSATVEPVPEYVEDCREDPLAGPHRDDLPVDGSGDEMWANLGVNLRDRRAE
jgi:hypothetical protein